MSREYNVTEMIRRGREKYRRGIAGDTAVMASQEEYQDCSIVDLFADSSLELGGKDFVRVVDFPQEGAAAMPMVVKRYDSEFIPYKGPPIAKEEFLGRIDPSVINFVDAVCDEMGELGVPRFIDPCLKKIRNVRPDEDSEEEVTEMSKRGERLQPPEPFAQTDLVCDDQYHEFLIGSVINEIVDKRLTVHLPRTYSILACPHRTEKRFSYYILIELLRDVVTIDKLSATPGQNDPYSIMIQAFHTLHLLHDLYKLSHNDLHPGNVLVAKLTPDVVNARGERLIDYDYWEYRFRGKSLYVPRTDRIIKIIDFGLSCKFKGQVVCSHNIAMKDFYVVPPTFNSANDVLMLAQTLEVFTSDANIEIRKPIFRYMYDDPTLTIVEISMLYSSKYSWRNKQLYGRVAPEHLPDVSRSVAGMVMGCGLFDGLKALPAGRSSILVGDDGR